MTHEGTIVKIAAARGFGFIKCDAGGRDVFVHARELPGMFFSEELVGTRVAFEIATTEKGEQARCVRAAE